MARWATTITACEASCKCLAIFIYPRPRRLGWDKKDMYNLPLIHQAMSKLHTRWSIQRKATVHWRIVIIEMLFGSGVIQCNLGTSRSYICIHSVILAWVQCCSALRWVKRQYNGTQNDEHYQTINDGKCQTSASWKTIVDDPFCQMKSFHGHEDDYVLTYGGDLWCS